MWVAFATTLCGNDALDASSSRRSEKSTSLENKSDHTQARVTWKLEFETLSVSSRRRPSVSALYGGVYERSTKSNIIREVARAQSQPTENSQCKKKHTHTNRRHTSFERDTVASARTKRTESTRGACRMPPTCTHMCVCCAGSDRPSAPAVAHATKKHREILESQPRSASDPSSKMRRSSGNSSSCVVTTKMDLHSTDRVLPELNIGQRWRSFLCVFLSALAESRHRAIFYLRILKPT